MKSFRFTQPAPAAPAAAQVVFASRRAGQLQLYVMPVLPPGAQPGSDQANPRPLTQGQDWSGSPVVAPDGRRVAYVVETRRADGSPHDREIYLVDVQGGKPANLTSNPALDFDPAWSPDGKQIAFVSNRDGEATSHGIYVIDVAEAVQGRGDGSARRIVEDGQAPAWSPDGGRIAFISDRDTTGQFQAYLVNADGSGLRRLTDRARSGSGAGVGQPAWSPDGTRLALPAGWDGNREIYLLTVAGSGQPEPVNVTNDPGYDDYPAWSPDGKQIAFISTRSGSPGLYLMDGGGENVIALAPGLDAGQPAWSRDGTRLAFVVSGPAPDFDQDIYVVNRDGSGLANLSRSPGQDTFPAWAQIR